MRHPIFPLCLLLSAGLSADGLSDLRGTLGRLQGREAVKVQADYQFWNQSIEDKQPTVTQGQSQAQIEDGPAGLRLGWTRQELDQAQSEGRKGKKAKDAKARALDAFNADKADHVVNGAKSLLEDLEKATLKEYRTDTWQGRPARLLVLSLDPDMDADERKHIKRFERTLKLWLDAEGTPLAAEDQLDLKGSYFLISFEMHHKSSRSYQRSGNRLLLTREESEQTGSGMGQKQQEKSVLTAKVS